MDEPLFLKPVFHNKIWGGTDLNTVFNYSIPSDHTGECWGISGHSHGLTQVTNGALRGQTLDLVWAHHPELFGNRDTTQPFPLLTKILDAHDNLSIQVHPDNDYAARHEHELGKTECWYVIKAEPGAQLYYGHHAQSKQQLSDWIMTKNWSALLRQIPVKTGDFFYVPSGTVHALGKGIMVLETQQSSDSTYRLYDFDRVNQVTHQKRALHLKQSIDTITVPHHDPQLHYQTTQIDDLVVTTFIQAPYFSVSKWTLTGTCHQVQPANQFTLLSVINGTGALEIENHQYALKKGDHLILPTPVNTWTLSGEALEIIASNPGPEIK